MIRSTMLRLGALVSASLAFAGVCLAQTSVDFPLTISSLPSYDRVNGVSLPFGPTITVGDDRLVLDPRVTYRSNLGKIDPSLTVIGQITSDSTLGFLLRGSRGTFTNERWIRSDLINSLVSFGLGHDSRNYFRADRAEARLTSALKVPLDVATVFVGARTERDWSTGWRREAGASALTPPRAPFSVLGRKDSTDGMWRPNPAIDGGHITSVIGGGQAAYTGLGGAAVIDVLLEAAGKSPAGGSFRQLTVDNATTVNTFAGQHLDIGAHLVTTSTSGRTPLQRFAYVGGSGSLATVNLLGLGGDHLYWTDLLYVIPVPRIDLPFFGSPYIAPHFAAGAAGVDGFGRPVQTIGGRIGLSVFTIDYLVNPRTHQSDFGAGISLRP